LLQRAFGARLERHRKSESISPAVNFGLKHRGSASGARIAGDKQHMVVGTLILGSPAARDCRIE
jgi:hypothetical protein